MSPFLKAVMARIEREHEERMAGPGSLKKLPDAHAKRGEVGPDLPDPTYSKEGRAAKAQRITELAEAEPHLSPNQISQRLQCSHVTVGKVLRAAGLHRGPQGVLFALALMLSGCVAPCSSGIVLMGSHADGAAVPGWTCAGVDAVARDMTKIGQIPAGYLLWLTDHESNPTDPWGRKVDGYTNCATHEMVVWSEERLPTPAFSALAHELAHTIDDCATPNHEGWKERGVFDVINRAGLESGTVAP